MGQVCSTCHLFTVRTETERGKGYREKGRPRSPVLTAKEANENKRTEKQKLFLAVGDRDTKHRLSLGTKFLKSRKAFNKICIVTWSIPKEGACPCTGRSGDTRQPGTCSQLHSFGQKSVKRIFNKSHRCGCSVHILTSYLVRTRFSRDSWVGLTVSLCCISAFPF